MTTDHKKQERHFYTRISCLWLVALMFCTAAIAGCGKTPPDRALLTGTSTPTQQAVTSTANASSHGAPIVVVGDQSHLTAYPGGNMSLSISTSPYTVCQFLLYYGQSSPSKGLGIIPRTTDAHGKASWSWQVNLDVHTGTWPLKIAATAPSGAVSTTTVDITVTLPPISLVGGQSNLIGHPTDTLTLSIATAPWVNCDLLLNYGPSAKTLHASANIKGIAAWSWRIDRAARTGVWPLMITVVLPDGESTSTWINVTIL